jgi:LuxR family maltose regulon positive regulatory protein
LVQAAVYASRIQLAKGNAERALEILERVKAKIDSPDHSGFMKKIEAQEIYISQRQGSSKEALSWLDGCGLSQTDDISMNRISEYIFYARMLMDCGQMTDALYLIERLYRKVCNEDSLRDTIKVLVLHSLMMYRKGNVQSSLMKLAEALHLAEPEGYVRSFVDEGDDMGELLSRYLHLRQNSSIRESTVVSLLYVKKLLLIIHENSKGRLSLSSILTSQEEKILRLVEKGLSNKQIAEYNNVTIGTVKTHIKNMYRKLEVNSRLQALQRGKELDLL